MQVPVLNHNSVEKKSNNRCEVCWHVAANAYLACDTMGRLGLEFYGKRVGNLHLTNLRFPQPATRSA